MIIRLASAKIRAGRMEEFKDRIERTMIPYLESQEGLLGRYPGVDPNIDEFVMVSLWKGQDSLKAMGGPYWNRVVIPVEEIDLLEEVHVHHYEGFAYPR